jgi:general secretion pathway protein G
MKTKRQGGIKQKDEGFTYMETLIVLALTVILSAGIGIPALQQIERAKNIASRGQIETFKIALQNYWFDCNAYPSQAQGLEALFTKPVIHPVPENWKGPYLDKKIPVDPWGNPYRFSVPGPDGLPWSIVSFGADGKEGGKNNDSDVCSWE